MKITLLEGRVGQKHALPGIFNVVGGFSLCCLRLRCQQDRACLRRGMSDSSHHQSAESPQRTGSVAERPSATPPLTLDSLPPA